ncbi:hypothetical protein [Sulfurimonas sp.]|uniref:hypothetical protein n=1 Tax=Sulfurimonas sp. TaxID=2022749 RepID=UPI002621D03E|nr:hypothetical protein [Sulfurimonas sp.]
MIDAEFRSEERFSRMAIGFDTHEEKVNALPQIENITKKCSLQPEIYTTKVSSGKEVYVIEYHDDCSREAGPIFEEIMKVLDIKICS